jgi:2-methylisocitrate lyase-like PEP mutase family enzyme
MIQIGSGSEYDRRCYEPRINETPFFKSIPVDTYGLTKFSIATVLENTLNKKFTNLRCFGVFGKYEDYSRRFISNNICNAIDIPMIVDGDTGYGNAMNVRRTLKECSKAGCAGILIEDQLAPKRCGHTPGKDVVEREEAFDRIRAANDMRNEGYDILIMARTDANHTHGLSEAIARAQKFYELGADILFVEAPKDKEEMTTICKEVPGYKIANIVEGGITPNLPMKELTEIGYKLAVYPLTVMSAAMKAMTSSLNLLFKDEDRSDLLLNFKDLRHRVGFDDYYEISSKYETSKRD